MSWRVCECGQLTENKLRCDKCEKARPKPKYSYKGKGGSSTKNGYGYDWQKLRERYIAEHPLCEDCVERLGTPLGASEAEEIHHKVPITENPDLRLDWNNLRALCVSCHRKADAKIAAASKIKKQMERQNG